MRDMTMVTNTQIAMGSAANPLLNPLSYEQELAARIKLMQALQTTLEPKAILALFFKHIQTLVRVYGMAFTFADLSHEMKIGRECAHRCNYRLTADEGYLGEITFSRSKRFTEDELLTLEILLGSLTYPLRNALHYQTAIRNASLDPLTMLGNRHALDSVLRRELKLAERHHHELSLLMIDVDFFKAINDKHGHSRGDQVLREIANIIQRVCRESDITFRYGGEEFVVVLGKTDAKGAEIIAERIRSQIEDTTLGHNGSAITPTVSIGIATRLYGQKEHINDLFERADQALYHAKAAGRNRVINSADTLLVG